MKRTKKSQKPVAPKTVKNLDKVTGGSTIHVTTIIL